jgi:hypothetical protein
MLLRLCGFKMIDSFWYIPMSILSAANTRLFQQSLHGKKNGKMSNPAQSQVQTKQQRSNACISKP